MNGDTAKVVNFAGLRDGRVVAVLIDDLLRIVCFKLRKAGVDAVEEGVELVSGDAGCLDPLDDVPDDGGGLSGHDHGLWFFLRLWIGLSYGLRVGDASVHEQGSGYLGRFILEEKNDLIGILVDGGVDGAGGVFEGCNRIIKKRQNI